MTPGETLHVFVGGKGGDATADGFDTSGSVARWHQRGRRCRQPVIGDEPSRWWRWWGVRRPPGRDDARRPGRGRRWRWRWRRGERRERRARRSGRWYRRSDGQTGSPTRRSGRDRMGPGNGGDGDIDGTTGTKGGGGDWRLRRRRGLSERWRWRWRRLLRRRGWLATQPAAAADPGSRPTAPA